MKRKKILVVGSLVEDLVSQAKRLPNLGETVVGLGFSKAPGGKGANQAVAASLLDSEVTFYGATGDDMFSRELVVAIRDAGIDTTKIKRFDYTSSGASAVSLESVNGQKQNSILMNPGANFKLTVDDVRFLESTITAYDIVVLQFEVPMEVNEYIASLANSHGVIVVVNPAPSKKMSDDFISHIDYLIPNEHEAYDLTGIKITSKESAILAGKALLNKGIKNVIITLGENGSLLVNNDGEYVQSAIKGVKAVDPTAAGDSYCGAFVSALAHNLDINIAMKIATYYSALTVTKLGAIPSLCKVNDLISFVESNKDNELAEILKTTYKVAPSLEDRLDFFKENTLSEVGSTIERLDFKSLLLASEIIHHAESNLNRIHITGIGKPGHVAEYLASLLSSTGTPTYFLHGTEAVHGSCGQLVPGDVVICISNSGETSELKATMEAIKRNGCKIIGVSGNKDSYVAHNSDAFLLAKVSQEGGPLNKAPRASILSEIIVLQALSVILQAHRNISPSQYVMWHPGGKLGESIKK